MKPRILLYLSLGIALLAPACGGKVGAETAGKNIGTATSYNLASYKAGERRTPKAWVGSDLSGATLRSSAFHGSVTVVNIWASWCAPCRVEQPELQKVSATFRLVRAAAPAKFLSASRVPPPWRRLRMRSSFHRETIADPRRRVAAR